MLKTLGTVSIPQRRKIGEYCILNRFVCLVACRKSRERIDSGQRFWCTLDDG